MKISILHIYQFVLALVIIIVSRVFVIYPIEEFVYSIEFVLEIFLIIFTGFYFLRKLLNKIPFHTLDFYCILIFLLPIIGSIAANKVFGQPIGYGILAQRDLVLVNTGILIYYMLDRNYLSFKSINQILVVLAWLSFIVFIVTANFYDISNYKAIKTLGYNPVKGGVVFRFNVLLMIYGLLFHFIQFLKKLRFKDFLAFLILFSYIIFVRQDRTIVLFLFIDLMFAILLLTHSKVRVYLLITISSFILLATIVLLGIQPERLEFFTNQYQNVVEVVSELGNEDIKGKGYSRVRETYIALQKFYENPIFGNGELSKRWEGGYARFYDYFYPSDIGLLGILFIYGIFGTLLIHYQWWLAFKWSEINQNHILIVVSSFNLLFFYLNSLSDGGIRFKAGLPFVFLAILYYFKSHENKIQS